MKIIKTILLLTTIIFFTSIPFSAEAAVDCSEFKKFSHKWNMCKISFVRGSDDTKASDGTKKKKGIGFFKKLRQIGGKNIGEPG